MDFFPPQPFKLYPLFGFSFFFLSPCLNFFLVPFVLESWRNSFSKPHASSKRSLPICSKRERQNESAKLTMTQQLKLLLIFVANMASLKVFESSNGLIKFLFMKTQRNDGFIIIKSLFVKVFLDRRHTKRHSSAADHKHSRHQKKHW